MKVSRIFGIVIRCTLQAMKRSKMSGKSPPTRTRRAALTDLLLAYIVIAALAVTFYVYFITSATQHVNAIQISRKAYQKDFLRRQRNTNKLANQWGDNSVLYNIGQNRQGFGFPNGNGNIKELSAVEKDLMPVESYLGDETRPQSCDNCFKYNVKTVIQGKSCLLSWASKHIDVLVLITSAPGNIDRRNAVRETWLSPYQNNTSNVRYLFLLGLSEYMASDALIQQENTVHGDILQGDFLEDYHNLTYKTLMGMTWAVHYCKEVKLIIKVDDDVWLNIPTLLGLLHYKRIPFALGGKCTYNSAPARSPDSKWYASFRSYPEDHYPPFCAGPGYVLSPKTAANILEVSKNVPYFHLEDVYIGMCIQKLKQRIQTIHGFMSFKPPGHLCHLRHNSIVLIHEVSLNDMRLAFGNRCGGNVHNTLLGKMRHKMWA
ncbi:beta-1,3-galactosyltransferase 5-like [Haliotis rufescens]|uniref:beta-1,3-galactosyltransferase 5-like n=1 Tax=Haliotis rufescens TaxID=6454 RepID=UPI001EB04BC6|nr:beta-1,3-galactosyltransferase 5-like [Haliotis rufescens]